LPYPTHSQYHQQILIGVPLNITGAEIGPHEVAYLPSAENVRFVSDK
jgi:hypothetical protein